MDYALLGATGIRVSEICLGTMTFGNEADEPTARAIMDRAVDAGINFFDTADIYNKGLTEEIVGRWLDGRRDNIVLASKVHFPSGDGPNDRGSSRRHILLGVEESLKRLKTDRLDILYLHHWDPNTDLEVSLRACEHLIAQGKVLHIGVSNFSAWQVMKALSVAALKGLSPLCCIQPMYNLVKRQVEVELLPLAEHEKISVFPYSPIGAGLLTGKYQQGEKGRLQDSAMYAERYKNPAYADTSQQFVAYARERGLSPAALAVAWVGSHPAVTAPIIGARNLQQFNDTLGCLDIHLTQEERATISAFSIDPPLATDRESMGTTLAQLKTGAHAGGLPR